MSDIVAFLNARLDEDERIARAATAGPWEDHHGYVTDIGPTGYPYVQVTDFGTQDDEDAIENGRPQGAADSAHIARHDPARVLREVAAKRAVVELHTLITKVGFDSDDEPVVAGGYCGFCQVSDGFPDGDWPCDTLKLLVAPDADHPDYDPTWSIST